MLVLQFFGSLAAREGLHLQILHPVAWLCGDWLSVTDLHTNMMITSFGRRMSLLYSYSLWNENDFWPHDLKTPPSLYRLRYKCSIMLFLWEIFKLWLFFFFFENASVSREQAERGRENNLKQSPSSVQSLMQGSIPQSWNHDLSQNQVLDAQPNESPRHPLNYDFSIF